MRLSEGMNIAAQQRAAAFTVPPGLPSDTALALVFSQGQYYQRNRRPLSELKGWSFTRTGARAAEAADGSLTVFESGVPRILPGEGLKVSAGGVNLLSAPEDFTNAAWAKDAGVSYNSSTNQFVFTDTYKSVRQTVAAANQAVAYVASFRLSGSGDIQIYAQENGGDFTVYGGFVEVSLTDTPTTYEVPFTKDDTNATRVVIRNKTDTSVIVRPEFVQLETGSTASDYIPGDGDGSSSAGADEAVIDLGLQWALKGAVTALDVGAYGAGSVAEATVLDDDFSGYADQAAAEAAGYVFGTGWAFDAANKQIDASSAADATLVRRSLNLVSGETYSLEVAISNYSVGGVRVFVGSTDVTGTLAANGTFFREFTASSATPFMDIRANSTTTVSIDSITIRRGIPDRSGAGNAAVIKGTLTAAEVASGSDLLALSGFSASSYLEVPYSSDLDFGTGDWFFSAWVRASAGNRAILTYGYNNAGISGAVIILRLQASGLAQLIVSDDGLATFDFTQGVTALTDGSWHFVTGQRRGSALEVSVDGQIVGTGSIASASGSLSNANASALLGVYPDGTQPMAGPITLPRIIKGRAPTAREIEVLYAYERSLFEADATLPGWAVYPGAQAWDNVGGLNPQEGFTVVVDYEPGVFVGPGGHRIIGQAGTNNPSILSVSNTYNVESWNGFAVVRTLQATESTPRRRKAAFRWDGQNRSLSLDGSVPVSAPGDPQVGDKLYLGKPAIAPNPTTPALNGTIYSVFITPPKSDAELVTLSGGSV